MEVLRVFYRVVLLLCSGLMRIGVPILNVPRIVQMVILLDDVASYNNDNSFTWQDFDRLTQDWESGCKQLSGGEVVISRWRRSARWAVGGSAMHQNTRETWDAKGSCVRWKKQPAVDMLTICGSERDFEGL